jgi:hypothetical protein
VLAGFTSLPELEPLLFNMKPLYRFTGVDVAIALLRPNAKYEFNGSRIVQWDDSRPEPTPEEIKETQRKAEAFENSIPTVWLQKDLEEYKNFFSGL